MAKSRKALSSSKYDREFPDIDDSDHMASAVQQRAMARSKRTTKGLLESLAHSASYDDNAIDDIVIDPSLVDEIAERRHEIDENIIAEASPELRKWFEGRDKGKRQRARYALVRFFGPTSEFVASGLSGPIEDQIAVIQALANPLHELVATAERILRFPTIPAELLPLLRPLFSPKAVQRRSNADENGADWRDSARLLQLLLRIEPGAALDQVHVMLLDAIDNDEYRPLLHRQLGQSSLSNSRMPVTAAVRSRFDLGAGIIEEARKAGLPNRTEITALGILVTLVQPDAMMARRIVSIFDLIGSTTGPETVEPFAQFLSVSIDLLGPDELVTLAAFMTRDPEERLPAAAAAWVRLEPAKAKELARRFHEGDRARVERRWLAAARAQMANAQRKLEIGALIPETALGAALGDSSSEMARPILETLVRKARNSAELLSAVTIASARREGSVLRPILEKLRDTPYRMDAKLEKLLIPLVGPENEDDVRQEIDGENPFRDRREALGRALAAALKGR